MNEQKRIAFIDSLEIADIPEPGKEFAMRAVSITANPPKAYVCGGSTVSFVAGVSPQSQRDGLNSTLLAQLAANKAHDRENDTVNWYKFYRNVLENVGWVIQDFSFARFEAQSQSFTMDKVVLDLIAAIGSNDEVAIAQATIDALKALPQKDGRLVLFESMSHSASKGNFQISIANEVGGVLTMRIAGGYFSTSQSVTNVLWFSYAKSQTSLYTAGQGITLNSQIYSQVRSQIVQKLGDKARIFVQELPT